nr:Coenzyme F420 hydrogenase/dehydrogenase, beta subunit C-terminal domain [uncultured Sellimonas sp.]
MSEIQLFTEKKDCCACGACLNICPRNAISFQNDEYGFAYPHINRELCIKCGLCKKVCNYQKAEAGNYMVGNSYVALTNNTDLMESTSGGVFASIAKSFLKDGGCVYGATMEYVNGELVVHHIGVYEEKDLPRLLGSKYVQSNTENIFKSVKNDLNSGKKVLFCGTPCQVDGLRGYLGEKYQNLLLIDLVCHGVPGQKIFVDFIKNLEKRQKIVHFRFRDKNSIVGYTGKIFFENGKEKFLYRTENSYTDYFLKGYIQRENCYSCKYASDCRPGDMTIGDFWGIQKEHPELMKINGGMIDPQNGVSCLIVNTEIGKSYLEKYKKGLKLWKSEFSKIAANNEQLNMPSKLNRLKRESILQKYRTGGYKAVEHDFRKEKGIKFYFIKLKNRLRSLKRKMGL